MMISNRVCVRLLVVCVEKLLNAQLALTIVFQDENNYNVQTFWTTLQPAYNTMAMGATSTYRIYIDRE